MAEIATPHQTRPNRVLITEPITMENRGQIARWAEDRGFEVGVPGSIEADEELTALLVKTRHGIRDAWLGDRVLVNGGEIDVIDFAHYKLWYEPIEEPTP